MFRVEASINYTWIFVLIYKLCHCVYLFLSQCWYISKCNHSNLWLHFQEISKQTNPSPYCYKHTNSWGDKDIDQINPNLDLRHATLIKIRSENTWTTSLSYYDQNTLATSWTYGSWRTPTLHEIRHYCPIASIYSHWLLAYYKTWPSTTFTSVKGNSKSRISAPC